MDDTVEVVIRLHRVSDDIEIVQDRIFDALYAAGFTRIEPVSSTLIMDESDGHC